MSGKSVQNNCILTKRNLLNWAYPVLYVLGRCVGLSRDNLERKYIRWSNSLNYAQDYQVAGEKILLLVPHCLQRDACEHKITRHIENCHQCGGCKIGSLVDLQKKYGCHLEAATGGTLARQLVKKYMPEAIVAVACERDLSSGLMDVYPMPVIGVLNERPFGPCFNTDVDLAAVESALQKFIGVEHA